MQSMRNNMQHLPKLVGRCVASGAVGEVAGYHDIPHRVSELRNQSFKRWLERMSRRPTKQEVNAKPVALSSLFLEEVDAVLGRDVVGQTAQHGSTSCALDNREEHGCFLLAPFLHGCFPSRLPLICRLILSAGFPGALDVFLPPNIRIQSHAYHAVPVRQPPDRLACSKVVVASRAQLAEVMPRCVQRNDKRRFRDQSKTKVQIDLFGCFLRLFVHTMFQKNATRPL